MTTSTVVQIKPSKPAIERKLKIQIKPQSKFYARRRQQLKYCAQGILGVATSLTGLSLDHLSSGIAIVTSAAAWQGWSVATTVDLGFIGLEIASVVSGKDVGRPIKLSIIAFSAVMNAFAFAHGAQPGVYQYCSAVIGAAIPVLIFGLMREGTKLYLSSTK